MGMGIEITDEQLRNLPNDCPNFNQGVVIINKEILKDIVEELLELRAKNNR